MEKSARPAAGSMSEKREDPTQDFIYMYGIVVVCVCVDSKHANNGKVYITGVFFIVVKSKHVNSIGFSYLWSSTKKKTSNGV